MSDESGNIDSKVGKTENEATSFDSSSDESAKTNHASLLPPSDHFFENLPNFGWETSQVLRTMGVEASQIGGENESPSFSVEAINSKSEGAEMELSKEFEPIPLRSNSRPLPLVDILHLQRTSGLTTAVSEFISRDRAAINSEHQSFMRSLPTTVNSNGVFLGQPNLFEDPSNMQQMISTGNYDPNRLIVNGAPAGMGSIGWSTNLPYPQFCSIPGNHAFPWAHANSHSLVGGNFPSMPSQNNPYVNPPQLAEAAFPLGQFGGAKPTGITQYRDFPAVKRMTDGPEDKKKENDTSGCSAKGEMSETASRHQVPSSAKKSRPGASQDNRRPKMLVNPNSRDVCFALIKHPGTKVWRTLVDSLAAQPDVHWSQDICQLIKSQLTQEGRRFLVCDSTKGNSSSKVIKNRSWCIASDNEIWLRTRQRFRDCRKSGNKGTVKRNSELKTSKHVPVTAQFGNNTKTGPAAAVNLASALQGAIAQCQVTVNQASSLLLSNDQRLIQKAELAKQKLELLEPMINLRWSHVLENELEREQGQRNKARAAAPLDMSILIERGRQAHRIKKLKKAEAQIVNFIQTLMESEDEREGSARVHGSSSDDSTTTSSPDGGDDDDEDDDGDNGGNDSNERENGGNRDDEQNGDDNHGSEETESDEEMEDDDEEEDEAAESPKKKFSSQRQGRKHHRKEANGASSDYYQFDLVTVFQAAPLAYRLKSGEAHPLPLLDIDYERRVLTESLQEGCKQLGTKIDIDFEVATTDRLAAFLLKSESRVMHLSCHGHPDYLALDNGWGGMQILRVQALEHVISFGAGNLDLVFLSSCSSRPAGEVFVTAGVPHVVCCYQSHKPRDVVAIDFARQFYLALACGKTLKVAFKMALHCVQISSLGSEVLPEPHQYLLLPEKADDDPYHDVQIFQQRNRRLPGLTMPRVSAARSFPYLPRPSRGQTLHMFHVLEMLAKADVVKVVGVAGGRRLAAALAGYVRARPHTMMIDVMFWLPPIVDAGDDASRLLQRICNVLLGDSSLSIDDLMGEGSKYCTYFNEALSYLVGKRCLFVINGKRFASEAQSLRLERFMCELMDEMYAKIILACADGQEHYHGPPRHHEQIRVYNMETADDDRVVPLNAATTLNTHELGLDNDNDSVSDLSANSGPPRNQKIHGKQKTISPETGSNKPLEIKKIGVISNLADPLESIGGANPNRADKHETDKHETGPERERSHFVENGGMNGNGLGAPVTTAGHPPKFGEKLGSTKSLLCRDASADDSSTGTSSESTEDGIRSARPNKTLDQFDATMSDFVSARMSRRLSSSESNKILGTGSLRSAATPFMRRSFTQGFRMDSIGRPRLYGRDIEISLIKDAFSRISHQGASSEIVVVHGPSGSGKSTLVKHMEDFLAVNSRGIYSVGKFDEIRSRAKPYSAIVDALSRLIGKIANSDELEDVKINMKEVFGSEAKVLCELVPAISQLTGETASGETKNLGVGKGYAFTRFRDLIRSFMRVISSHDRPILLFLDDLQWADKASCALMESLASDPDSENILFVWAYRDSENGKEAPSLVASVAEKSSLRLLDIPISAIDSQSLTEMISYLAQLSQEEVKPLSDLLSRRTGGNIHFVIQFLHMLQHQGLLVFSEELQQWDWDIELIETETVVTDNVADILTAKIARQPGDVQSVLQLAACLGFFFDIKLLETISRAEGILSEDPESFAASCFDELEESSPELWRGPFRRFMRIAQGESLIIQTRDPRVFRFSHDRVRQCAYEMIRDAEKRERLHLRVGMFIWTQIKMKASDDLLLLLTVDQLNRGSRHIQDEDTRTKLAKLNLDSAKRAGLKSAYTLAADLLNKGIRLLNPRTKWLKNTYDLCLELYTSSAEMECSLGNFENCDERVEAILARAHSIDEKLRAYYVLLDTLGIRRRLDEGINTGTEVLSLIGERLPRRPGMMKVLVELAKTKRAIKGRKSRDLSSLPMIKEARPIATMRILGSIALFAWHSHNNNLLTFVFLRMTRVTLTQGLCKYSPFAFAAFGMLLGALGDTMQAHEFGTLALQLLSKAKTKDCTCSTQLIVGIFVEHLKKPLSSVAPDLMEAYRVGMENGDVQYACLSLSAFGGLSAVMGKPLRSLIADLHRHRRIYQEYNQDHADVLIAPWLQFALNMTGQADNLTVLTGEAMNEANFMSEAVTLAKVNVHFIRMILLYILGQVEAASVELEALERCQGSTEGTHFMTTFIIMYSGLVSLAMAQKTQRRKYIAGSRKYMNLISKYVKDGRMNCPPLFCLLQAIQKSGTSDKSRKAEVHQAFDDAISANARGGFLQFEAIANEMAGEFMLSCQDLSLGHSYLHRAWQLYSEWQADAKVQQLETKYRAMQITTAVNSSTRVDNSPGRGD